MAWRRRKAGISSKSSSARLAESLSFGSNPVSLGWTAGWGWGAAAWGAGLVSIWIAPAMAAVLVPLYAWMRYVTYRDDQRLLQMILRMKLLVANPNRRLWKARSYSPHLLRK